MENQFKIEMKDDNSNEQSTDLLIEPIVALTIDKPLEISPTIATRFLGIFYILLSTFIFVTSTFITKELNVDVLDALIPCSLIFLRYIERKHIKSLVPTTTSTSTHGDNIPISNSLNTNLSVRRSYITYGSVKKKEKLLDTAV
ncbi:unnamed protein product [Rotaria sp. Silwood1]|nr:unnamed protein product [Rotaria sp. Silwood1]